MGIDTDTGNDLLAEALDRSDNSAPEDPRTVLEDLFLLLEDYSPTWYTEAQRNRVLRALDPGRGQISQQR
jgi:hypothetical protein